MKVSKWDPVEYLDTTEAIAFYLDEAIALNDVQLFIAVLGDIARSNSSQRKVLFMFSKTNQKIKHFIKLRKRLEKRPEIGAAIRSFGKSRWVICYVEKRFRGTNKKPVPYHIVSPTFSDKYHALHFMFKLMKARTAFNEFFS